MQERIKRSNPAAGISNTEALKAALGEDVSSPVSVDVQAETAVPVNVLEKAAPDVDVAEFLNNKIATLESDKTALFLENAKLLDKIKALESQVVVMNGQGAKAEPSSILFPPVMYEIVDTMKPDIPVVLRTPTGEIVPSHMDEFGYYHYRCSVAHATAMISSGSRWVLFSPKELSEITVSVKRGMYLKNETFKRHVYIRSERRGNNWQPVGTQEK